MVEEYNFDNIYIRHAIDEHPDVKTFSMHLHERCEIYLFISGNVSYLVEGSTYSLGKNSLMIMSPVESHMPQINKSDKYERYVINFPLSFADFIDPEGRLMTAFRERPIGVNNMFQPTEINTTLIYSYFLDMFKETDDYNRQLTTKSHLISMLDMINRALSQKTNHPRMPQSISEHIVLYVNNHLFDDLSIPALANRFFLSTSHFNRIFRNATGAAPWEYITKKRLTVAKDLLQNNIPSQSVSIQCGFKDYSTFYRAYKKHFGHSPNEDTASV